MKNIQEVLRDKEAEIEKLTREIKLLRVRRACWRMKPRGSRRELWTRSSATWRRRP